MASAQVTPWDGTGATDTEGFDYQTLNAAFPTCVEDRVFYDKADLCGLNGGFAHITGGWGFGCSIGPNNTPRLFGGSNHVEFEFDDEASHFGGFFGTNNPTAGGAHVLFTFTDGSTHQVDLTAAEVPNDCTWHHYGWQVTGANIKKVELWSNYSSGGYLNLDDMEAIITTGQTYPEYCTCEQGGTNTAPCGNFNDATLPLGGCQHDDSNAGAHMSASGMADLSADTLALHLTRGPTANSALFFQANNNLDGTGAYIGDGIQCAGGGLVRLQVKTTVAGAADTTIGISAKSAAFGHTIVPGETLYYQCWIRDPAGSPCGNESNTSNGVEVKWQ
jgi:hypothetical protein